MRVRLFYRNLKYASGLVVHAKDVVGALELEIETKMVDANEIPKQVALAFTGAELVVAVITEPPVLLG